MEVATTKRQRDVLLHALGNGNRNYYCAIESDDTVAELIELGLMERGLTKYFAHVTEAGKREVST